MIHDPPETPFLSVLSMSVYHAIPRTPPRPPPEPRLLFAVSTHLHHSHVGSLAVRSFHAVPNALARHTHESLSEIGTRDAYRMQFQAAIIHPSKSNLGTDVPGDDTGKQC